MRKESCRLEVAQQRISRQTVLRHIESATPPDAAPFLLNLAVASAISSRYNLDGVDAAERAEDLTPQVLKMIQDKNIESQNSYFGYFYHLRISEVSDEYIHGACHVFPNEDAETSLAKARRARHLKISQYVERLNPNDFELFCGKLISLIGVKSPVITPHGGDQGIDFFGRWDLQSAIKDSAFPDGVERQFKAWLVGQAKRYDATTIGTAVVRELVGSVQLAKSKVFSSSIDTYAGLGIAYCDPVFYCLIITGSITSGVARLLQDAGIIFFDRDLIGVFLADLADNHFDPEDEASFRGWALGGGA